ncbi:unnamed protein product [Amoebophrya sp. A25]|nr:unnamed protein product [Amoebophrya sp. A25]|eukprot:GSA25T00010866001.1
MDWKERLRKVNLRRKGVLEKDEHEPHAGRRVRPKTVASRARTEIRDDASDSVQRSTDKVIAPATVAGPKDGKVEEVSEEVAEPKGKQGYGSDKYAMDFIRKKHPDVDEWKKEARDEVVRQVIGLSKQKKMEPGPAFDREMVKTAHRGRPETWDPNGVKYTPGMFRNIEIDNHIIQKQIEALKAGVTGKNPKEGESKKN